MEFKHPKYYKELRKLRNNLDQAISSNAGATATTSVRPGSGLKQQAPAGLNSDTIKQYNENRKKYYENN